jgi:DNA gyrase/topoisomerase IV subunit A
MLDSLMDTDTAKQGGEEQWPKVSSVANFIDTQYRAYSNYVLYERAIPNLVDGFKPSQRKVFCTGRKFATVSKMKSASLSGQVISYAAYHHGNASLDSVINSLTADYNNNLPIFKGMGSFGSRLIQEAAASRYTFVQYNSVLDKIFVDDEIVPQNRDPESPEPAFYLPIVPWVLVNGIKGMAIGFATHILPRDHKSLAKACQQYLQGKNIDPALLVPKFPEFTGVVEQDPEESLRWFVKGTFERKGKTTILITEVPYGHDRVSFIDQLETLKEKNVITSYVEHCRSTFKAEVRMQNADKLTDAQILTKLKLVKTYKENPVVIDDQGKVRVFTSAEELLKAFCDVRLTFFDVRYSHWIDRDTEQKALVDARIKFIELVLSREIDIKDKTKSQLKAEISKKGFDDELLDHLVSMPIYHLCKDKLDELKLKSASLAADIETWKNADSGKEFIKDLGSVMK